MPIKFNRADEIKKLHVKINGLLEDNLERAFLTPAKIQSIQRLIIKARTPKLNSMIEILESMSDKTTIRQIKGAFNPKPSKKYENLQNEIINRSISPVKQYKPLIKDDKIFNPPIKRKPQKFHYFTDTLDIWSEFKNLLQSGSLNDKTTNIIIQLYGTRYQKNDLNKYKYIPDSTSTILHSQINLTEFKNSMMKQQGSVKGYKVALVSWIYRITGLSISEINSGINNDSIPELYGRMYKTTNLKGVEYTNFVLFNGSINCVLDSIKNQYDKNDESYLNKLEKLNDKYYISGVNLQEDIEDICKVLKVNIKIYDKINKSPRFELKYNKMNTKTINILLDGLNHASPFNFKNIKKSELTIKYIDGDLKDFSKNLKSYHIIKKHEETDIYKYIYDDCYIYKNIEMKGNDKNLYYINSTYDLIQDDFIIRNNLQNNIITKEYNPDLFNFINSSIHHLNEYYYKDNTTITKKRIVNPIIHRKTLEEYEADKTAYELDPLNEGLKYYDFTADMNDMNEYDELDQYELNLNDCVAYDRNKHFVSYPENADFPSHKFNYYHINKDITQQELNIVLDKTGFIQIDNIICKNRAITELHYFINGYVYPIFIIKWFLENGGSCTFINCCYTEYTQTINFTKIEIDDKHYNKIIGCMSCTNDKNRYAIKCNSKMEAEDLKFNNENVIYYDNVNSIVIFEEKKEETINRGHIASFIIGYATLEILKKLSQINYNDIIGVKVDCIILKQTNPIFTLSILNGDYKIEAKTNKIMNDNYNYINKKSTFDIKFNLPLSLMKLQYKTINMITGMAGTGKTTRFYKEFKNDERISDALFLMPTNALLSKFKDDKDCIGLNIQCMTFQMLIHNFTQKIQYRIKQTNIILDEATMCDKKSMTNILQIINDTKTNIFIVGDYDYKKKVSYQLKPVNGVEFFTALSGLDVYELNLTRNYRQKDDLKFSNYLQSIRGKSNTFIMNTLKNAMFLKDSYNNMINNFTTYDIIISPYEAGGKIDKYNSLYINKMIYNKTDEKDYIKCSFLNTTLDGGSKNEHINIIKKNIDFTKFKVSSCNTSHIVQGMEYLNRIYIINDSYFSENQLYVMLSRAHNIQQLIIIK